MEGGERALEGQAVVAVLAWLTLLAPRVRQGKHPALTGNKGGRATRVAASFGIVLAYVLERWYELARGSPFSIGCKCFDGPVRPNVRSSRTSRMSLISSANHYIAPGCLNHTGAVITPLRQGCSESHFVCRCSKSNN